MDNVVDHSGFRCAIPEAKVRYARVETSSAHKSPFLSIIFDESIDNTAQIEESPGNNNGVRHGVRLYPQTLALIHQGLSRGFLLS